MSDLVLSTGEVVPELAEAATVLEDGPWRLVRKGYGTPFVYPTVSFCKGTKHE